MFGEQWSAGERSTSSNHSQSNGVTAADDCSDIDNILSSATGCDVTDNPCMRQNSAPVDLVASCSAHAHNHSPTSASASTRDVNASRASPPPQYNHGLCAITALYKSAIIIIIIIIIIICQLSFYRVRHFPALLFQSLLFFSILHFQVLHIQHPGHTD